MQFKLTTQIEEIMIKKTLFTTLVISGIIGISSTASAFVVTGTKWGNPIFGTGANVSWSLMPSGVSCNGQFEPLGCTTASLSSFMPVGFKAEIERAFQAWSNVANINFVEVADTGLPFDHPNAILGNIRLAGHIFDGPFGTLAHGYYPPPNGNTAAGDIHFDVSENWTVNSIDGNRNTLDIFQVAAHEIGHAIGLKHTNVLNSLMYPYYSENFSGLQADDIAGVRYIYGSRQPINNVCNLPTQGGIVHLDLNPSSGCSILPAGGGTRSVNFTDTLNSINNRWNWETQVQNVTNNFQTFVAGFFFPNGGSPVIRRVNLNPGEIFGINIRVQDRPPELGRWLWSARSFLGFPIGIDTSVTESPFISRGGSLVFDPTDPDEEFIYPNADDSFSISFFCSSGNNCSEDTTDDPDIIIASVPEPTSTLSLLSLGILGAGATLKRKVKRSHSTEKEPSNVG
jgi:hypothetical protein